MKTNKKVQSSIRSGITEKKDENAITDVEEGAVRCLEITVSVVVYSPFLDCVIHS